jgi:hypothetical protein
MAKKAKGKAVGGKAAAAGDQDSARVDIVAAAAKRDHEIESPGPDTGGTMPLFPGCDPELRCKIYRKDGEVVVEFSALIDEWTLKKRQTRLACRLIDAQAGEITAPKIDDVDQLDADLELGAEIVNDGGAVVVRFETKTRTWKLRKRGATLATGLIRARARPLPADAA